MRLNVYMTAEMRQRLKDIAALRGTTEGTTARWLMERAMDWYDRLTADQQAVA